MNIVSAVENAVRVNIYNMYLIKPAEAGFSFCLDYVIMREENYDLGESRNDKNCHRHNKGDFATI